jgi:serine/threonine protein kinase
MEYVKRLDSLSLAIHEISITLRASVPHSNIIPIIDISFEKEGGRMVMPRASSNLFDLISYKPRPSNDVINMYIDRIGSAVDYLHQQGIVHRDLKSDNILMLDGLPYLTDFGISIYLTDECHWSMCCSDKHKPPEAFSELDITNKIAIDMWALGILILEIVVWQRKLFDSPIGELATIIADKSAIGLVKSKFHLHQYEPLLTELLMIDPEERRLWYDGNHTIKDSKIYLPLSPLLTSIKEELLIPDHVFTRPINNIEELWVLCCEHDIYLSDKYCAGKIAGDLYSNVLNVARDVFRPGKGSINSNSG